MAPFKINKESFFCDNENVELLSKFPWNTISMMRNDRNVEPQNEPAMSDKNHIKSTASKNKSLSGLCFITDVKGFFIYVHPNFLKLFEGVENQFFETSIFDFNKPEDMPPTIDYLVDMIQERRNSVFIESLFNNNNSFSKLQWNISYYGGLLNFNLFEKPVSPVQEEINLETVPSKNESFISEREKINMNIEQAKSFYNAVVYPENTLLQ